MAQICETVTATSMSELRSARDRATDADLVELRLDGVSDADVAGALENRSRPVIVTCRAAWEGGRFDGSEDERFRLLGTAIDAGAEYVDVEWKSDRPRLAELLARCDGRATRLVLSHHNHECTPIDLVDRVRAMRSFAPNAVVKIATLALSLSDCVRLRDALASTTDQVSVAMGSPGLISRLCPWLFGSLWTYGGQAAPGQMAVADLVEVYRVRASGPGTAIYALTGSPLSHSASPILHNALFARLGLNAVYVPMESSDGGEFLSAAEALGVSGASVTAPLKTAWNAHGVRIDRAGREVGAINTLKWQGHEWQGCNFDVAGFLEPLTRRGLQLTAQRVVVLGAGGAARAAVWALKKQGSAIEVATRRNEAAVRFAAEFGISPVLWPPKPGWDLLVNATPVGTWPKADVSPLEREFVRGRLVYDLVYNPAETMLMRLARGSGGDAIGGWEMLLGQARAQFEYWTGTRPSDEAMAEAARAFRNRSSESR